MQRTQLVWDRIVGSVGLWGGCSQVGGEAAVTFDLFGVAAVVATMMVM